MIIDSQPNKPKNMVSNHKKKRSSRILHIEMPEELINMLHDSKDMLEDPNANMNYFEIESLENN